MRMAAIKEVPRYVVVDDPSVRRAHRHKEDFEPLMAFLGIFYGWIFAGAAAVVALLIIFVN